LTQEGFETCKRDDQILKSGCLNG